MQVVGFPFAIVAAVVTVFAFFGGRASDPQLPPAPKAASGRVEVGQVVVRNGPAESTTGPDGLPLQRRETMPTIDLTVLNRGGRRVLLTAARVEVLAHAVLPECAGQGGGGGAVPVSGAYTVELPAAPPGEAARVSRPLHQQVAPDGADRITLRFLALLGGADLSESALYQLRVQIVTSERRPLDVGRFLVAAPGAIERSGATLPESDALLTGPIVAGRLPLTWTWCYRRNLTELRRMLALPGRRSPDVAALAGVVPAAHWRSAMDPTPAREAAVRMLGDRDLNPLGAAFAAASTHDAEFADSVRVEAAARLLASARGALAAGGFSPAISAARASLELQPTPAAKAALADAVRLRNEYVRQQQ